MITDEWVVRVVLATAAEVSGAQLDKMADAADDRDATAARWAAGTGIVVTADADAAKGRDQGVSAAIDWALKLVSEVGGCDDATPVDVRFMTLEAYEAEALRPDIPELVSAADAADILGISRQRVHQLMTSNVKFPAPVARVATGPLWTRAAIEWFDSVWERKAGRPAKLAPVTSAPSPVRALSNSITVVREVAANVSKWTTREKRSPQRTPTTKHVQKSDRSAAARAPGPRQPR
ncbi:hypothetical protein [Saccharothrix variisporea]|uniref:hypothetical protein n=1 Tax=Saccharothrix variisporea TaxID=543527 RepID=UPI0011C36F5C|nr:hypothetical protein [Saccharothrix variisporea]